MQDNKSQPLILAHSVKGQMSFCHVALSVICPSTICQNRYWDFNQHYVEITATKMRCIVGLTETVEKQNECNH